MGTPIGSKLSGAERQIDRLARRISDIVRTARENATAFTRLLAYLVSSRHAGDPDIPDFRNIARPSAVCCCCRCHHEHYHRLLGRQRLDSRAGDIDGLAANNVEHGVFNMGDGFLLSFQVILLSLVAIAIWGANQAQAHTKNLPGGDVDNSGESGVVVRNTDSGAGGSGVGDVGCLAVLAVVDIMEAARMVHGLGLGWGRLVQQSQYVVQVEGAGERRHRTGSCHTGAVWHETR